MKKAILLIPLSFAGLTCLHAQSVGPATLNAMGNTAIIAGNEYDWSVGEMSLVSTFSGSSIIVTQGVLQPSEGSVGVPVNGSLARQIQVFPNPATAVVNIQYTAQNTGVLSYKLMDMQGKLIASKSIDMQQGVATNQVNVSALANATYMLQIIVSDGNTTSETVSYKIEKIK